MRTTRRSAKSGRSTQCTTTRTCSPTPSRGSRTPSAPPSSRRTGRYTIGSSTTCPRPRARGRSSSRASTCSGQFSPSASSSRSCKRGTWMAGMTRACPPYVASVVEASRPRPSPTSSLHWVFPRRRGPSTTPSSRTPCALRLTSRRLASWRCSSRCAWSSPRGPRTRSRCLMARCTRSGPSWARARCPSAVRCSSSAPTSRRSHLRSTSA
mmetsp:Transcript_42207/g.90046  ORF Transcript_42207/g.90046 Transcript_42207/m.90046 type:complete len:210 (+) Transcript_42207:810-1439(+)